MKIDGKIVPYEFKAELGDTVEEWKEVLTDNLEVWVKDSRFVIDVLEKMNNGEGPFSGRLDMDNLGIFGHSFGGSAVWKICLTDERIKAGLSFDGPKFGDIEDDNISPPYILINSENWDSYPPFEINPDEKDFYDVTIIGTQHNDLTDMPFVFPLSTKLGILGPIKGERVTQINTVLTISFFDKFLKDSAIDLEEAASVFPEVIMTSY